MISERDAGEDVAREVPPVRAEVERDRLAFLDQVVGVRHGASVRQLGADASPLRPSRARGGARRSCRSSGRPRAARSPARCAARSSSSRARRDSGPRKIGDAIGRDAGVAERTAVGDRHPFVEPEQRAAGREPRQLLGVGQSSTTTATLSICVAERGRDLVERVGDHLFEALRETSITGRTVPRIREIPSCIRVRASLRCGGR